MSGTRTLLFAAAIALSTSAFSQNTYQQERARCMDGSSGQEKQTCLREMGAAAQEMRKKGGLTENENYQANQLARCEAHKDAQERSWCERRMRGEGTTTGSVTGGGILRELVVTVPAN